MKKLTQLINSLKRSEIAVIRSHYHDHYNGVNSLRLKFFEAIKSKQISTDEEASQYLYSKSPDAAYSQLKKRLKGDIINILVQQESTKKSVTPFVQAQFECRRMLTAGELLLGRGAYLSAKDILVKASKLADNFELFLEQIAISSLLSRHFGYNVGAKGFVHYNEKIKENFEMLGYLLDTNEIHDLTVMPSRFKLLDNEKFNATFEENVSSLEKLYKKSNSALVGFQYYRLHVNLLLSKNQLEQAIEKSKEYLKLVERSPAIYSKPNIAGINYLISGIYLNKGDYQLGVDHALTALKHFKRGLINELRTIEMLFLHCIYGKMNEEALAYCERGIGHKQVNSNNFWPAKWLYFKANIHFRLNDFETSMDLLQENTILMRDKTGWLLGYKILEMMNLIELKNFDLFSYKLDTFGKLLQYIKTENIHRVKLINKLLRSLNTHGFDFSKTIKANKDSLELLQFDTRYFKWRPNGFEIIRFDEWLVSKAKTNVKSMIDH